ncbi:unnamed protein product [Candidula unifasciata]|uniref:Cleavage inducing molecular chaperone Jiv domain-containing protein n=1 Tax=Candidula unifasciata TaxID=100452 RepID=A0A8S3ZUX3_9EUPU|nr:unnamed protein product [Candidula unifasciata]
MIGDPVKRKQYDGHTQEAQELQAMRKFAEMLSKLQTKIQEAANMMYCDVCGGKHRRVPVDRPFYSARFCQQCNARHSAKAGDIWAESTLLGFYWHYFALLDGHVFDITDWMKCHKEYFKHMKANSHTVTYKLATDGSSRHHNTGGAKLQDFMNCLFKASSGTAQGHNPSWNSARADKWTQAAGSSSAASKNTHHKKRHL